VDIGGSPAKACAAPDSGGDLPADDGLLDSLAETVADMGEAALDVAVNVGGIVLNATGEVFGLLDGL
jgi:hypothetical protein